MAYIGKNPRLKSIVSQGDTLANLTAEARVAGRVVYATDTQLLYLDDGTSLIDITTDNVGGGGGNTWDIVVPTDQATVTLANTNGVAKDSVKLLTQATAENPTISKELGIFGSGRGSEITGNVTFATGSDGSSLSNLRVDGDVTIDLGVKNLIISNVWITGSIIDNSGNRSNLVIGLEEE